MKSNLWIGGLVLAALVLQGCGSRQEPASAEVAAQQTEPAARAPAASPGKPRAPVEAAVIGEPALQSGVPGKVEIEVRTGVAADALNVQVAGDAVLAVVGQSTFRFGPLAAGEAVSIEVAVTPISGGVARLSALLTLEMGGQTQARAVTLALDVGGPVTLRVPAEKPVVPPVKDATGELVHSMPAETTVGKP